MSSELNSFLEETGLTEYEARALASLFTLKEAQAPQISRNSQVPKTRVYDVLERLTKKGLIIEVSGRPKRYKCMEPEKVFDILLSELKEKLKKLQARAEELKNTISSKSPETEFEKVLKVKDKNDFYRILVQEIESAKKSVNILSNTVHENNFVLDSIKKASGKNVEIKIISGINSQENTQKGILESGIKIKKAPHGLEAFIIDDKKVILSISDLTEQKTGYHFTIWPQNPHMANALQHYFDKLWTEEKA